MSVLLVIILAVILAAAFAGGAWAGAAYQRQHPSHRIALASASHQIAIHDANRRAVDRASEASDVQAGMQITALREGAYRQAVAELGAGGFDQAELGPMLRASRHAAELTQDAVARRSGVSVDRLSTIELGRRQPDGTELERLASVLGLDFVPATVRVKPPVTSTALALAP